jgi:hypothetical protein
MLLRINVALWTVVMGLTVACSGGGGHDGSGSESDELRVLSGLSWEAESGTISPPFKITSGTPTFVSQGSYASSPSSGGRAAYVFSVSTPGKYSVHAVVNAPDGSSNSVFLDMDAEPDSTMIWDIPTTNGYASRVAGWRGSSASVQEFNLTAGTHTLIIRGREPNCRFDKVSVVLDSSSGTSGTDGGETPDAGGTNGSDSGSPSPKPSPSWNGDFSTGDWSQYDDCRSHHMDGVFPTYYTIVRANTSLPFGSFSCSSTGALPNQETGPTPPGFGYAAKYTVDANATTSAAGQRTLDTLWANDDPTLGKSRAYQGATTWYRSQQYFPADFKPIPNNDWNWTYEIHQWPDGFGIPFLSCGIDTTNSSTMGPTSDGAGTGERFSCRIAGGGSPANPIDATDSTGAKMYSSASWFKNPDVRYTYQVGVKQIQRLHWYDFVFRIKWSWQQDSRNGCTDASSTTGCFEWWIDGTKVASWSGPTLEYYGDNNRNISGATPGPGQGYLDHGYYRSTAGTWSTSVYHGATMLGPTAASIGVAY